MSEKPFFVIKHKIVEPMLPTDSNMYDEVQETRIQIIQAINGYLTINMLYESFKLGWSFWHYQKECPAFSYLSLGFLALNLLWAFCSYFGFRSIRSKNSRNIRIFSYTVLINFLLRIGIYIACGVVMNGYVPSYISLNQAQVENLICTALYSQSLYIITGILEAIISLFVMFLLRSVIIYVEKWEESETEKHIPKKLNTYSDY